MIPFRSETENEKCDDDATDDDDEDGHNPYDCHASYTGDTIVYPINTPHQIWKHQNPQYTLSNFYKHSPKQTLLKI